MKPWRSGTGRCMRSCGPLLARLARCPRPPLLPGPPGAPFRRASPPHTRGAPVSAAHAVQSPQPNPQGAHQRLQQMLSSPCPGWTMMGVVAAGAPAPVLQRVPASVCECRAGRLALQQRASRNATPARRLERSRPSHAAGG